MLPSAHVAGNRAADYRVVPAMSARVPDARLWMAKALPKHTELVDKLRERLWVALDPQRIVDERTGEVSYVPAETNTSGLPNTEWRATFRRYSAAFNVLLVEDREGMKVQLLAKRAGMATLSPEEFEREMIELGREAVREISDEEIAAEIRRRGLALPPGAA